MVFFFLLIIVFLDLVPITCTARFQENGTDREYVLWENLRLPKSVLPREYDIFLHPNLTTKEYSGKVNITCSVRNATNFIVLHSKDLEISLVELKTLPSNDVHQIRRQTQIKHSDQLYLETENAIPSGSDILISIDFYGRLINLDRNGFYVTEYFNHENEIRYVIFTYEKKLSNFNVKQYSLQYILIPE
jgi:hypothetical protein